MAITKINKNQSGNILVEMAVAISILSLTLIGLMQLATLSLKSVNTVKQAEIASLLARAGMDSARNFRDNSDWYTTGPGSLTAGAVYHPEIDTSSASTTWTMIAASDTSGAFQRQIIFDNVSRDPATKNIESVYNAANDDPDTKLVTVIITWGERDITLESYMTNWH